MGSPLPETIEEVECMGKMNAMPEAREMLPTKGRGDGDKVIQDGEEEENQ
jgi:hypothetical protein